MDGPASFWSVDEILACKQRHTCLLAGQFRDQGLCPEKAAGRKVLCKHSAEMLVRLDVFRPSAACVAGQQLASWPCSYHTGQVLGCPLPNAPASGKTVHSIFLNRWSQPRAVPMGDAFPTCILSLATSLCCCPTE